MGDRQSVEADYIWQDGSVVDNNLIDESSVTSDLLDVRQMFYFLAKSCLHLYIMILINFCVSYFLDNV